MNKKYLLIFGIFLVVSLLVFVSAESVIADDDFESSWSGGSGWINGWWHEGDSKILTSDFPYEGDNHLRLRRSNGYVDRSVDLSSYSDAKIGFWVKIKSFERNDFLDFLVSSNGIDWSVLRTFTPVDSDSLYHYYEFDLTQYGLTSNFYIAIDAEMSGSGDYFYLDDLKIITSENVTPPEPPQPPIQPSWHIQYNPLPDPIADVAYWNFDLFDVPSETIQNLKDQGVKVMCYFSAGSYEDWRTDALEFPNECIGASNGWPGENWINTRCSEVREIMANRIDLGITKGCDGFDPDNMDAYGNGGAGFGLTEEDAIDYYNFLADYAHSNGAEIGLKNALTIIDDVLVNMDWAVNEQCFKYNECFYLEPVIAVGKPVFQVEYGGTSRANKVCSRANELGFTTLIKKTSLNAFEISCLDW
ncbi:MAG: endo alpha-1,4 polygalactosaminidase [Nanoarchaeota archaeon]|nr:endo alpha-1,4 polygalactosaminidase [Nanoarchaeota archaeon]MBU1028262.1 endo alpha-1,4 polygalactosaminidase [Nanoarchaeota archaeon]